MKFESDSDRRAWRTYAAHTLGGLIILHMKAANVAASLGETPFVMDATGVAEDVGKMADAMLEEETKRRDDARGRDARREAHDGD
jgi:hypothetical protein